MRRSKYNNNFIYYDNIKFKSKLEVNCYKIFKEKDLNPQYEPFKLIVVNKQNIKINAYIPSIKTKEFKKINFLLPITYVIDFYIKRKLKDRNVHFFIETKGIPNDTYPIKKKLLLTFLNNNYGINPEDIYFFEVHNINQINECVQIIKSIN